MLAKGLSHYALAGIAVYRSANRLARGNDAQPRGRSLVCKGAYCEIVPSQNAILREHGRELSAPAEAVRPLAACQTMRSALFRQQGERGPWPDAPGSPHDRPAFSCAHETHACACGASWMVDRYVSWAAGLFRCEKTRYYNPSPRIVSNRASVDPIRGIVVDNAYRKS